LFGEVDGESILSEMAHVKSPPLSPRHQHGGRSPHNKAVGDVVIARSISVGSENCSTLHADIENTALRRLKFSHPFSSLHCIRF